jgi:hypothetical protein
VSPDKGKRSKGGGKRKPAPAPAARTVDPRPPYVVRWHAGADAERDAAWPEREKVAMWHAVDKLKAAGARLGHPHSSAVQGEKGKGFRELRPRAGRSRWRPIYRQVTPDTFVVFAVGPEAQIDQGGFNRALSRAVSRFTELELD